MRIKIGGGASAMTPLFEKLNLGEHREIVVLDAPPSFEEEITGMNELVIQRQIRNIQKFQYALFFVKTLADVEAGVEVLSLAHGDAIAWFVYPKGTSKNYKCEFHRDNGFTSVHAAGWESVRMVAIDADWSALRFRKAKYVKKAVVKDGTQSGSNPIPVVKVKATPVEKKKVAPKKKPSAKS
jgi:hypothetical protein